MRSDNRFQKKKRRDNLTIKIHHSLDSNQEKENIQKRFIERATYKEYFSIYLQT